MGTHPHFEELIAHDDADLARLLGAAVVQRETINEWPLSWVQRLRLADGRQLAYKSQLPPTVEPAFYAAAASPLLPGHRRLDTFGSCSTMVIDWIDAPLLADLECDEPAFVRHAYEVVERIGQLDGTLPVYLDLGGPRAWRSEVEVTLGKLERLVRAGRFPSTSLRQVDAIRAWTGSAGVVARFGAGRTRVVHGDLRDDQIFVAPDGYRVIDWQRPIVAPAEVDLVSLLDYRGIDPLPYVDREVVGIRWYLLLRWAVEAQHDLLPELRRSPFDEWAADAVRRILG